MFLVMFVYKCLIFFLENYYLNVDNDRFEKVI